MNELEKARRELNEIDRQMVLLFENRMKQVERVIAYKTEHNLEILDTVREQEVFERNLTYLVNSRYMKYYERFIKYIMKLSKEYQQELSDDMIA